MAAPRSQVPQETQSYDPNQDLEEKRAVRAGYRSLLEQAENARSEAQSADFGSLSALLAQSNDLYLNVKAPSEGVLDSRVLISVAQTGRTLADSLKRESGFNIDVFLDKALRYVGGTRAAARAALSGADADAAMDDDRSTTADWDWHKLGRTAMKYSRRAPTMDVLLGPLETELKKRHVTHTRRVIDRADHAEKPAELGSDDIQQDANNTSAMVIEIKNLLDGYSEEGVNMFDFAFDPASFGNTVENLFYVSFLVREGRCAYIMPGDEGNVDGAQPKLMGCEPPSAEDYEEGLTRQQVILELDPPTWRAIIDKFGITQCVIPTRKREAHTLERGKWYA